MSVTVECADPAVKRLVEEIVTEHLEEYQEERWEPLVRRWWQPWLWQAVQIDALLDPTLAVRTWVYDSFGLVVNPRQAQMIEAIQKGQIHLPQPWRAPL